MAVRLAIEPADRAWIALAIGAMLLGAISMLASLPGLYTPLGFLATQGILSAAAIWLARVAGRRIKPDHAPGATVSRGGSADRPRFTSLEWAALSAIAILLILSLIERPLVPIYQFDDLVYHGSRAGYWIQNQSILPFPTHDLRQTSFPFGAELLFAWPLLFTGSDLPGRLLFWTGLPLTVAGVYSLARALEAPRSAALFAALLYAATPRVVWLAATIKPDLWAPLFAVGAAYWIARALRTDGAGRPAATAFFWAGVLSALAMNIKVIVGAMIPVLAIAPFLLGPWRPAVRATLATAAGGLLASMLSGLAFLLVYNMAAHDHPLGPQSFRDIVRADLSLRQLYTHAVRLPLFLFELPEIPSHDARVWMAGAVDAIIARLGAEAPLPGEQPGEAPGPMRSPITPRAYRLGLGGMLLLPTLGAGLVVCGVQLIRSLPRPRLSPLALVVLAEAALLFSTAFLIRWMPGNDRFWLPACAVGFATAVAILAAWTRARTLLAALAVLAGAAAAYPAMIHTIIRIDQARTRDFRPPDIHWFGPALDHIPDGSTVIFFGRGSAHDYQLLAPDGHLVNRVTPWGSEPLDAAGLAELVERENPDFLLTWRLPPREKPELETWLASALGAREVPLDGSSALRLITLRAADTPDSPPDPP